jgi:hypothetical protein
VRLRLHGTPAECELVARRLAEVLDVVAISGPYPDRGPSRLVRVYLELRLHPTAAPPAAPTGPEQPGRGLP